MSQPGLSEEALRRPVRFWFRGVVAGEQVEPRESDAAGWHVALMCRPRPCSIRAGERAIIAATPLNTVHEWSDWRFSDLRETILHVITETACHAGHLDAVRELIDGRTWLVLTE